MAEHGSDHSFEPNVASPLRPENPHQSTGFQQNPEQYAPEPKEAVNYNPPASAPRNYEAVNTQQTQPEFSPLQHPNQYQYEQERYTPSGTSNEVRGNSAGFTAQTNTKYSRFHEDQVLFKSNGFDGPSSRVNES